jgi:hypothetical protein
LTVRAALEQEWVNSIGVVELEGAAGAARFAKGAGRHGDFAAQGAEEGQVHAILLRLTRINVVKALRPCYASIIGVMLMARIVRRERPLPI